MEDAGMALSRTVSGLCTMTVSLLVLFQTISQALSAQTVPSALAKGIQDETQKRTETGEEKEPAPEKPSITRHSVTIGGKTLTYTATTGTMPLKDDSGKVAASLFFVAYVGARQDGAPERPVTFAFNGGPGAASLWLHLAALGPKRVALADEKGAQPPPYRLTPNEHTWLAFTDLVFIDPVGTGYSRAASGEFIRLYCTRYSRWLAPKFVAGESYGTTRAAGLSGYLQDKLGMHLNGIILISSALNFETISFGTGNDLPYALYLPVYANTAWYHKKLSPSLQKDRDKTRSEVERFSLNEYLAALAKGNSLSRSDREKITDRLAAYTGLSKQYIISSNLRVSRESFMRELLRGEHRRVGLLDSRITGAYQFDRLMDDPSMYNVSGPLVGAWNDYVRTELGYENDANYEFLSTKANDSWNWGSAAQGYVNVVDTLAHAMEERWPTGPFCQWLL
jgi:carboxypeptidase C (cathepsin A)